MTPNGPIVEINTDGCAKVADRLGVEKFGAFMLLSLQASRVGSLPRNDETLAGLARVDVAAWREMAGDILPLFLATEDRLFAGALFRDQGVAN